MNKYTSPEVLEHNKKSDIYHINELDKLTNWENYLNHWEKFLSSDYWKNWRERINSFQTEKEVNFYKDRLRAFIDFVKEHTRKDIIRDIVRREGLKDLYELISNELKKLENINEEEFNKTDKWRNSVKWRELSTEEVLNDPWFSEQINNIFGLESKGDIEINNRWEENKNALTTEINHLKAENNQTKLNKKIGQLEKIAKQLETDISQLKAEVQELKKGSNNALECDSRLAQKENELQVKQSRLEQLSSIINSNSNSNSNSLPSSLAIGGVALTIIGLVSFLFIRNHRKNK